MKIKEIFEANWNHSDAINISSKDLDKKGHLIVKYPETIDKSFDCWNVPITSLVGVPKYIKGNKNFNCGATKIQTLEGGPEIVSGNYHCYHIDITSLKGAALIVGGFFDCSYTPITSLQGIGKDYLQSIGGQLTLDKCDHLKSHMLGILKIEKLKSISFDNKTVQEIINKYLFNKPNAKTRDILACQDELIENGFKEFAKL